MLLPPSKTREAKLIDINLRNAFIAMSSLQKNYGESQYVFSDIPHPVFNSVLHVNTTENEIEKVIHTIYDDYKKNNIPHCWWISECAEPMNVAEYLKTMGFQKGPLYIGMHVDIKKVIYPEERPNITIEKISHIEEIDNWATPIQESFNFSNEVGLGFATCFKNLFIKDKRFIHYIAYYNDVLAGVSSLFLDTDSAGLYNGGVFSKFRQKGVLGSLGTQMVLEAKSQGYEDIIMQAADITHQIGLKAGFKEYLNFQAYLSPS